MRHVPLLAVVFVSVLMPATVLTTSVTPARGSVSRAPQLVAFRGFHFGGGGAFRRRHFGFGGFGRRGSSHTLRRIVHALTLAYFLHLFFSHGGLSILLWLLVIGIIAVFFARRRSRRYA